MKNYSKYRRIESEILEEIPSHWSIMRLKYLVTGKLEYGANEVAESEDPKHPRYIRITDFGDDGNLRADTFKSLPLEVAKDYLLREGDILFARSGATVGKTFQFKNYSGQACFAGYLIRARPGSDLSSDFLYYYTKSGIYENWKDSIFNQATIQNIGADKYNQMEVCVPPSGEQELIVTFLNAKTSQIDTLIRNKQKLIELLKEERAAIINQAVTKGIDPNVRMKDSGVEWLGVIPEHWEVKKLKYLVSGKLEYGANEVAEHDTVDFPRYIRITDFGDDGLLRNDTFKSLPSEVAKDYLLQDGDILFARSGATVGKTFQFKNYDGQACFAGYLIRARPGCNLSSDFLYHFTKSRMYDNWKNSIFNQATIQNIGADKYNILSIPVPPLAEQQQINKYILVEDNRVSIILSRIQREIELLEEYRTALISEVVTGKVCII